MAISFQNGVDDDQGFFLGEGGLLLADEMWFFPFHAQKGLEGAWFRFKRVWRLLQGFLLAEEMRLSCFKPRVMYGFAPKDWLTFKNLLFR